MGWLYLFLAALLEVGWTFSLKFINWTSIRNITWKNFFSSSDDFMSILPILGYIVFGIGNIIFFSLAMKYIPASTAFAVWMAVALIGVKIIDVFILKEPYSNYQLFFLTLILVGIIGLKNTG